MKKDVANAAPLLLVVLIKGFAPTIAVTHLITDSTAMSQSTSAIQTIHSAKTGGY